MEMKGEHFLREKNEEKKEETRRNSVSFFNSLNIH